MMCTSPTPLALGLADAHRCPALPTATTGPCFNRVLIQGSGEVLYDADVRVRVAGARGRDGPQDEPLGHVRELRGPQDEEVDAARLARLRDRARDGLAAFGEDAFEGAGNARPGGGHLCALRLVDGLQLHEAVPRRAAAAPVVHMEDFHRVPSARKRHRAVKGAPRHPGVVHRASKSERRARVLPDDIVRLAVLELAVGAADKDDRVADLEEAVLRHGAQGPRVTARRPPLGTAAAGADDKMARVPICKGHDAAGNGLALGDVNGDLTHLLGPDVVLEGLNPRVCLHGGVCAGADAGALACEMPAGRAIVHLQDDDGVLGLGEAQGYAQGLVGKVRAIEGNAEGVATGVGGVLGHGAGM
eukprot:CAMPEP_0206015758 /NCGR_PEP_ID=MMETSP1464-20131121/21079_1 /ASSEMBLY_ACC=CAM_ASM_001124 /TAXON_ID=119497 /ORGANISM="Exanthemachrysis gayraliae, Strain RCC1523" /LENGTH=358 /DNA_ID=CAMNT_0053389559 /DNA_START=41 /DNA_END=1114 /DNA_ORIENTATION=-